MVGYRSADSPVIYIYHRDHEHDRTYTENLVEHLASKGVLWRSIAVREDGLRPELQLSLDENATAVLGYNSVLDHSWLPSGRFLEAAERCGVPVLQWILDRPSHRWMEFYASTSTNSRFLLNSEHERKYFNTYCLPGALTATIGGVGPNQRSRIGTLPREAYLQRSIACMIPLGLRRYQSTKQIEDTQNALAPPLSEVLRDAIAKAQFDLTGSLQSHVAAALAASDQTVTNQTFHDLCRIVEQSVQTFRRLRIFKVAQKYPVLIQSDDSAAPFIGGAASLATNVGMQYTLAQMPVCRAVVSVSPMNGMIHDRTMNAVNAGCVAIAEDNSAVKGLLRHKVNALLFRYENDSLDECLDIVCNRPERAYEIAQAGLQLRDHPRMRFGEFDNILKLAIRRG